VLERAQVVGIVAGAVAVEGREHGEHGMSARQRAIVAAGRRDLVGACGERAALVGVAAQPQDAGVPRVHEGGIARGRRLLSTASVGLQRRIQAAAQMVDQADAPGQARVDLVVRARRPVQAAQRLVPVAPQLVRLAEQSLEVGVALACRQGGAGLDDGVDRALAQLRGTVRGQQRGDRRTVTQGAQRAQRERGLAVARVPRRRALVQHAQLVVRERQRGQRDLARQRRRGEPVRRRRMVLGEQAAARERAERLAGPLDSECGAQIGMYTLERRRQPHELADGARLLGEHFAREVPEQGAAGSAQSLDCAHAIGGLQRAHGLARQPHGGRPAARDRLEGDPQIADVATEVGREQRGHLVGVEGEVSGAELEHLTLATEAIDRERDLGPRGEDEVEAGRRLPAQRFHDAHRRPVGRQLVEIVEDEAEGTMQALLQGLAERRGEGVGARARVGVGVGPARDPERGGQVDR
jgi:hypothetical protein